MDKNLQELLFSGTCVNLPHFLYSVCLSYLTSALPLQYVDWGGSRTATATVFGSHSSHRLHDPSLVLTTP